MFGGGDTTAGVVMTGVFYLLKQPALVQKLKDELREYWPDPRPGLEPRLSVLETMPLLVRIMCLCGRKAEPPDWRTTERRDQGEPAYRPGHSGWAPAHRAAAGRRH